jgi:hypothetical protein
MEQMHRPNPFQLRSTTTVLPSNRIIIGRIRRRLLFRALSIELQHGAACNAAVAHCSECLSGPTQRKGDRFSGPDPALFVEAEDLGEARGDLRRTPFAVIADLQPTDLDILQQQRPCQDNRMAREGGSSRLTG